MAFCAPRYDARNQVFTGLKKIVGPFEKHGEAFLMQGFCHESAYGRSRRKSSKRPYGGETQGRVDIPRRGGPFTAHLATPGTLGQAEYGGPFWEKSMQEKAFCNIEA